jgi:hypothetical protein
MQKIYIVTAYDVMHEMIVNHVAFKTDDEAYKFIEEANQDINDYQCVLSHLEDKNGGKVEIAVYNDWVKNHPFQHIKNDEHFLIEYFDYQEIELL